jgi:hypothetical protein
MAQPKKKHAERKKKAKRGKQRVRNEKQQKMEPKSQKMKKNDFARPSYRPSYDLPTTPRDLPGGF